jgi:SAM-dependent methyltransferase
MKLRTSPAGIPKPGSDSRPAAQRPTPNAQPPTPDFPASGEIAVQFSRFAPYYDRFMHKYVNYKGWANYVLRIFRHYQVKPNVLLDLACGSGIPTMLLARESYRIYGVDRSETMLDILRKKVTDKFRVSGFENSELRTRNSELSSPTVIPILADMREFSLPEPVDAAISLYDSVNYLLATDDLARCFRNVYRSLKPDGIFVFDMNTIFGLATYWGDRTSVREVEDIYSIWATSFDSDTRISTLHLTFYVTENGQLIRYDEIHEERGYQIEEIEANLVAAGFHKPDFYQHSTFQPPGATTTRLMIVARK